MEHSFCYFDGENLRRKIPQTLVVANYQPPNVYFGRSSVKKSEYGIRLFFKGKVVQQG